jgi:hypothetical protein
VAPATELVALLKKVRPEVVVILGGPEVSFEAESQPIVQLADYVITGEADLKFAEVCQQVLAGTRPATKNIPAELPDLERVALPYDLYEDRDVAQRMVYVEATRGCLFGCEFCLSALHTRVRQFPLPELLASFQTLLDRGVNQFKFVDRTFNLNPRISQAILDFFYQRYRPGLFLHLEMIPDNFPPVLRESIARFPPGALQCEIGVQTFNEEVAARIQRRQDNRLVEDNIRFLREHTGAHLHADLIVGLPGETIESFAAGFDRLVRLEPQEIQVGTLKRLRGAPIARHDAQWQMIYNPNPPYEILQNRCIDFATMQDLRRFARSWDLVANSGNFVETTPLLWQKNQSPFADFLRWSRWLHAQVGSAPGIALLRLAGLLFDYLKAEAGFDPAWLAPILWHDYQRGGRSDMPHFLRPFLAQKMAAQPATTPGRTAKRQARHRGAWRA